ncbi:HNH endonuclease [Cyclobacterium qasimii]|uniref:HNH endonuclease n=1 Tax=Cyclobacterium qasimii TaxID=1350429 RepID=UPI001268CF6E|nr:hypothetical protein [Cyclobacterium qasimii]
MYKKKKRFASWLEQTGKSDGTAYQKRTVRNYTNQIERSIEKEFSLNIEEEEGLYGVVEVEKLHEIEKKLVEGGDSKRRKDLRSAFKSYERFVKNETEFNDPTEIPEEFISRTEGGQKVYLSRKAERDIRLRNQAIAIHGAICQACEFDFVSKYGVWADGFIEVHHLIPLGGKKI